MMTKLTVEQLMSLEKMTGRQYNFDGKPRERIRSTELSKRYKIPLDHHDYMMDQWFKSVSKPLHEIDHAKLGLKKILAKINA